MRAAKRATMLLSQSAQSLSLMNNEYVLALEWLSCAT